MADYQQLRLFVAGAGGALGRVEIDGSKIEFVARDHVDPARRSGRGGNPGQITALGSIVDCAGGTWLLASVERGRPRLMDPQSLAVVALLGRRREWRTAAGERSPFLPVICDRRPISVAGGDFLVSRSPAGGVDLLRVRPGEAIERWWLGEFATRVEIVAGARWLALVSGNRISTIDVDELVPGGCPLTDPRDVELSLRWQTLPATVVAVCDLRAGSMLRAIEREAGGWAISEFDLSTDSPERRGSWAIEQPIRWVTGPNGALLLAEHNGWTRVDAGQGPQERGAAPGAGLGPAVVQVDETQAAWLWTWRTDLDELQRFDPRELARGPVGRWTVPSGFRAQQLVIAAPTHAPDPRVVLHADELAELLALEPGIMADWRRWFEASA